MRYYWGNVVFINFVRVIFFGSAILVKGALLK